MPRRHRTALGALAAAALAVVLYALAAEARLGYDTAYQLVWGRELLDGDLPSYDLRLAPTPHPLQVLVAVPLALLGQGADEAMRALSLLAFGFLAVGAFRVGELLFGPLVGLLAAAVVASRPHLIELAYLGDADIPAAALMTWAGVAALRGGATRSLALLALAGLLRPEAWLLSLAYALWLARERRLRPALAALAVAGPVLWGLSDLAVTGDLLWSLHHTRTGTDLLGRETGAVEGIKGIPRHLNFLLGAPVLVAGAAGFVLGLLAARARVWGLAAVLVVLGGGFLVLALAGLSLQPRYLAPLAVGVAICAAIGGLGWLALGDGDAWRKRWRIAGAGCLVIMAAGVPFDVAELVDVRGRLVDDGRRLEALARDGGRDALRTCAPVAVPTIRPIPYLALWADTDPARFVEAGMTAPPAGTLVTPTEMSESWIGGGGDGQPPRVVVAPPPGSTEVVGDAAWRIYATC